MSEELKPCPFCGTDDLLASVSGEVWCAKCDVKMYSKTLWNTRPLPWLKRGEIEDALRERVAELEAALKPLADVAEFLPDFGRSADDEGTFIWKRQTNYEAGGGFGISVGDVKRAEKVLKK